MGARSKSATIRGGARKRAAKPPASRGRRAVPVPGDWEQIAQDLNERDDEIDCQRIVRGDGGRSLPLYYDEYN